MSKSSLSYKKVVYNRQGFLTINQVIDVNYDDNNAITVKPHEVLIKVKNVALNPIDVLLNALRTSWFNVLNRQYGVGCDYSGTVVAVGDKFGEKYDLLVNDKVCGFTLPFNNCQTLGEYLLLDLNKSGYVVSKIPNNLSLVEASSFPVVLTTAVNIYHQIDIKPHSKILVNGTGSSVGRYVLPLLKTNDNVEQIVGICSSRSQSLSMKLGADKIIDYKSSSFTNDILHHIKDRPFDIILDLTGSDILIENLSTILQKKGTYLNIAGGKKHNLSTDSFASLFTWGIIKLNLLNALGLLSYTFIQSDVVTSQELFKKDIEYIEQGVVTPVIDKVFKFDQFPEAWKYFKKGGVLGKVVIEFD